MRVIGLRRRAIVAGFGGSLVLTAGVAAVLLGFGWPRLDSIEGSGATAATVANEPADAAKVIIGVDLVSASDGAITEAAWSNPPPVPGSAVEAASPSVVEAASPSLPNPVLAYADEPHGDEPPLVKNADACSSAETCIDQYLWSLYQRTPKHDTIKVPERIKVTFKKKGKTRTAMKTIFKPVEEEFSWKDPKAAERVNMSLVDYVIGGMDRSFKLKLYHAARAMDDAGLEPGITSAFRDDYRQSIASGKKAASDSSYHGGSRRGGYGHGLAADLVSVRGDTRVQQWAASEELWKWIDVHGKEFGIGRPYLDKDPPHIGPLDGKEYAAKRGHPNGERAALELTKRSRSALPEHHNRTKRARTASSRVGTI